MINANLNSVLKSIAGAVVPKIKPVADFTSNTTNIIEGGSVNFTDTSTVPPGGPAITSWLWSFVGGTPSSSTLQNPTGITYATAGDYEVSLTATNADGSNTKTVPNYITVNVAPSSVVLNSWFNEPYVVNTKQTTGTELDSGPYYTKLF